MADNVEQGMDNLRTMLQSREKPESKQQLAEIGVSFEDYFPQQKNATAINESKIDWKQLDNLGLTRERLEQSGELERCSIGRRAISSQLLFLSATPPSILTILKHALRSVRTITAISVGNSSSEKRATA